MDASTANASAQMPSQIVDMQITANSLHHQHAEHTLYAVKKERTSVVLPGCSASSCILFSIKYATHLTATTHGACACLTALTIENTHRWRAVV
jgi:hypothetical protein